jgi:SAM-dependent methyltransferase
VSATLSRRIGREEGRRLFGTDPAGYERARPGHAERVYQVLVQRCGLGTGSAVLEIGAGTGQATRRLLRLGVERLVVVEPDPVLSTYLCGTLGGRVELVAATLEDARLPDAAFDLAAAASSFHWVDEAVGLRRVFATLRPGGWVGLWWTLFGEGDEPDAFITATTPLLEGLEASPTRGDEGRPRHALDSERRTGALQAAGFVEIEHELARWEASWDSAGIRALYGTFSPILRLEPARRTAILDEIERIAAEDFGGRVSRRLTTSLYTAQRPSG